MSNNDDLFILKSFLHIPKKMYISTTDLKSAFSMIQT